jgi:hypothetical protein
MAIISSYGEKVSNLGMSKKGDTKGHNNNLR